jgi:hypothetical protein
MIVISYRRQDSSPVAGRLYDRLQAEFGKGSVFMDFDSIPYGVDFREHIKQTLQRAKVVVAIIGADWSGDRDTSARRIDDPTDFVRIEIASALENGIPVIPVLVNNTPMPEAKNLPAELEGLAFRNGLALDTGIDFHHHADRLIAGIHRVVDPPVPPSPTPLPPAADTPGRKTFPIATALASLAVLAGIARWYFLIHVPGQAVSRHETVEPLRKSETGATLVSNPEPTATRTQTAVDQTAVSPPSAAASPMATISTEVTSTAKSNDTVREHTFTGKIGGKEATFNLRFEGGGRVTGTYSQGGSTYRLEGRHPKGKLLLLDEYTGERVTAHIELALVESANVIRWEGTMRNTPPDKGVFSVSFERSSSTSAKSVISPATARSPMGAGETPGEYTYSGKVGARDATFRLRFEAGDRVTGTYSAGGSTYRLEGRYAKDKLLLDEYTGERVTAHIELALVEFENVIRWEGTMRNTTPDKGVFQVSFSRPRK